MKSFRSRIMAVILVFVVCLFAVNTPANSAIIKLGDSGWSAIISPLMNAIDVPIVELLGNDSVVIEIDKTFATTPKNGLIAPLILEFMKTSQNAVPNIIIEEEYIVNDTGAEWNKFVMALIVNAIKPQAGFDPAYIPDGDQLENVFYSRPYGYNTLPIQLNFLDANGKGVPAEPPGDDVFLPGWSFGRIVIATNPDLPVGTRFGLKEIAYPVPEPATILALGLGSLLIRKHRKPKRLM